MLLGKVEEYVVLIVDARGSQHRKANEVTGDV